MRMPESRLAYFKEYRALGHLNETVQGEWLDALIAEREACERLRLAVVSFLERDGDAVSTGDAKQALSETEVPQ